MIKFTTTINRIDDLRKFCAIANHCKGSVDIKKDKYLVDGRSLMGLMSIDMSAGATIVLSEDEDYEKFKDFSKEAD